MSPEPNPHTTARPTIFLVEEDDDVRPLLTRSLRSRGYRLLVAASLLLGAVWAVWHLPLFHTAGATLAGSSFWVLLAELPAVAVVFTWVFRGSGGSALP